MVKRILLTGGCGFVGSHIVEHLLKNTDWEICILDRLDYASNGFDRLRDIKCFDYNRVNVYTTDLTIPLESGLISELGQFDYIVHAAAGSHVNRSISNPVPFVQNNVNSTLHILEFARNTQKNLKKFVYFSTDEVYGTAPEGTDYCEGDRFNPGNPYSASKAASECLCYAYSNTYKLPIQITNTMNVIGERQHSEKYVPLVINNVMNGETIKIHSNSTKTEAGKRHYIHARNVSDALLYILTNIDEHLDNIDSSKGKFNIVGEVELDNLQLAQMIASHLGKELKYEMVDFHSSRPGHDLRYSLDGDKLCLRGWSHPLEFEESLKNTINWYLEEGNNKWLMK